MVRNEEKYEQAVALRRRGFTLDEIAKICEVSKSTVSKWLKNNDFSHDITKQNKRRAGQENAKRMKLISKTRASERAHRYKDLERTAALEFKHYKKDQLFMAGLSIYMAIGDQRTPHIIRITSSRMAAHAVFISFAQEYLGVEKKKIRLWLLLYPHLSEEVCMKKWHAATRLPYSQFYKTQFVATAKKTKTLHHGVGNTIIGSTVLKRKLSYWSDLAVKELTIKKGGHG